MTQQGASRKVSAVERELDYMSMALAIFAPHGYDSGRPGDYGFADDMRASLSRLREALRRPLPGTVRAAEAARLARVGERGRFGCGARRVNPFRPKEAKEAKEAGAAEVSYRTLSEPQKRHLREMVGPDGQSLAWRPANNGEARCAHKLRSLGLLEGSFLTYSDGYYLSEMGLKLARGLKANPDV